MVSWDGGVKTTENTIIGPVGTRYERKTRTGVRRRKQDKRELERWKRKVREERTDWNEKREANDTAKQKSRRLEVENDCILKNEKQDIKGSKEYEEKQVTVNAQEKTHTK